MIGNCLLGATDEKRLPGPWNGRLVIASLNMESKWRTMGSSPICQIGFELKEDL
jgi:hypothetical protein